MTKSKKKIYFKKSINYSKEYILKWIYVVGLLQLGGPRIEMKTGRRDSKESYFAEVDSLIPNHNDSISSVLSRFQSLGVDVEGTVALLGILPTQYFDYYFPTFIIKKFKSMLFYGTLTMIYSREGKNR